MDESRLVPEPDRPLDPRTHFRRDRDRILYSAPFARLAEITQVVSPERGYVFHNRLTHSIKVAQIARTIAEQFLKKHSAATAALKGLDPDAAEAAGLAHDLGHPPFGHVAEHELNRLVRNAGVEDGFEGNAQSFRIVCRLAISDAVALAKPGVGVSVSGLNLTRSVLAGIIKYPWAAGENPQKLDKWGYYASEIDSFKWSRTGSAGFQRTLIAEIMDWSDDVTYAIHDLLDFYRAGLIPLELIRGTTGTPSGPERTMFLERVFARRPEWLKRRCDYEAALENLLDPFPFDVAHRYLGEERDEQLLYRFATDLISRFVVAITPAPPTSDSTVTIEPDARDQVDVLKEFIWAYVIQNPDTSIRQTGQRRAIRGVFREALRAARAKSVHFFSSPFRQWLGACVTDADRVRLAADYVAALTERELLRTYRRLQGLAAE